MSPALPGRDPAATSTGHGHSGEIACQFSAYPLKRERIGDVIGEAVAAAGRHRVSVRVQNLSTLIAGEEEEVFAAVREAFAAVRAAGSGVLVATFAGRLPGDDEVAEIQSRAGSQAPSGGGTS